MKKLTKFYLSKILITLLIIVLLMSYNTFSIATYISQDTEYVWSPSVIETSSDSTDGTSNSDFLDLSCESAILIEQHTRKNFI